MLIYDVCRTRWRLPSRRDADDAQRQLGDAVGIIKIRDRSQRQSRCDHHVDIDIDLIDAGADRARRLQAWTLGLTAVLAVGLGGVVWLSASTLPYLAVSPGTDPVFGPHNTCLLASVTERLGFAVSVVNILIWVLVGGAWWKTLGLW